MGMLSFCGFFIRIVKEKKERKCGFGGSTSRTVESFKMNELMEMETKLQRQTKLML